MSRSRSRSPSPEGLTNEASRDNYYDEREHRAEDANETDKPKNTEPISVGVFNLTTRLNEDDVIKFIEEQSGLKPTQMVIIRNPDGQSRRFGFAKFASQEDAHAAISKCDGQFFDGRRVSMAPARSQKPHERTPGNYVGRNLHPRHQVNRSAFRGSYRGRRGGSHAAHYAGGGRRDFEEHRRSAYDSGRAGQSEYAPYEAPRHSGPPRREYVRRDVRRDDRARYERRDERRDYPPYERREHEHGRRSDYERRPFESRRERSRDRAYDRGADRRGYGDTHRSERAPYRRDAYKPRDEYRAPRNEYAGRSHRDHAHSY
ncbi:MAG: hypothetical protein MHM6MM_000400 [Cercozoa sp. M6MM]